MLTENIFRSGLISNLQLGKAMGKKARVYVLKEYA